MPQNIGRLEERIENNHTYYIALWVIDVRQISFNYLVIIKNQATYNKHINQFI